jgi:hypothetical protein
MKKRISKILIWAMLFPFFVPLVAEAATQINLTTQVAGILPTANGGTGSASGVNISPYIDATGTSDAITANYTTTQSSTLVDGYSLLLGIATPNATTTPTFAPTLRGVLQTARVVKKFVNNTEVALAIGDLQGDAQLIYDLPNTVWILQNPPITTVPSRMSQITASVASSAVTVSAVSQYLDFRSATLGNGVVSTVLAAPAPLVIPSGATLGCVNAVQCQLVVLETLPTSGVPELAAVNISGGNNLDETTLLTTTTISSGATSASGVYATTGRSSLPFRVIGTFVAAEATAGTWATAPSLVQSAGGQALAAMSSLGYGQTWQTVTRTSGVTYYNTTGRPIFAIFVALAGLSTSCVVNGVTVYNASNGANSAESVSVIIPVGASYSVTATTFQSQSELR